ncbi:MAG: XdhC/CoxI family protein [Bacteroidota bacterium]
MREFLSETDRLLHEGQAFSAVTVIKTWGSAPRPVGSMMFVGPNLEMLGSVSGGCVEGVVLRESVATTTGEPGRVLSFGVSDNDAWSVGLTCGGTIEVYLEKFPGCDDPVFWQTLRRCLFENKSCVWATRIEDGAEEHHLLEIDEPEARSEMPDALRAHCVRAWRERKSQEVFLDETRWFLRVFPRKLQLIIVGAAHASAELVHLAHFFDFETIVIDPRAAFARNTHFSTPPDRIIEDYPAEVLPDYTLDEYTFAVVMAHDPKIDDQALFILLRSRAAYIGALSSKASNERRRARLLEAGFTEAEFSRIHAPVGLPIKSRTAREIALSIMAQIIAVKNQYL